MVYSEIKYSSVFMPLCMYNIGFVFLFDLYANCEIVK